MVKSWIVVAERSQARIYTVERPRGPLIEVRRLEHPEARNRTGELITDRPGRGFGSAGSGRHAMEPPVDPRVEETSRFAREVADVIEKARAEGEFAKLVLVAGPYFLGLLRQQLSPATRAMVTEEIVKNLGQYDARDIREHLPERL